MVRDIFILEIIAYSDGKKLKNATEHRENYEQYNKYPAHQIVSGIC